MKRIIVVVAVFAFLGAGAAGYYIGYDHGFERVAGEAEKSDGVHDAPSPAGYKDALVLDSPAKGSVISSPLTVSGKARGTWFFEASFPLVLVDWDGRIIAQSYATAQEEWMTEDYVPFEGTIEFEKPEYIGEFSKRGALILQKDNPSGLPEHDDAFEIPIVYYN